VTKLTKTASIINSRCLDSLPAAVQDKKNFPQNKSSKAPFLLWISSPESPTLIRRLSLPGWSREAERRRQEQRPRKPCARACRPLIFRSRPVKNRWKI